MVTPLSISKFLSGEKEFDPHYFYCLHIIYSLDSMIRWSDGGNHVEETVSNTELDESI